MEAVVERVVMRLNEVCETVAEKYSSDGELGDFCAQLLRHEKFVQWELLRETFLNFKEFETTLNRKRGAGCVNMDVLKQQGNGTESACTGLLNLVNIPRHGDRLTVSLDVQQEGVRDDDLLYAVYRLRKQIVERKADAAFLLFVTTSLHESAHSLDTNIRHLADKNVILRPKEHFVWDSVKEAMVDLEFELCPPGSKLALTLWRISK